MKDGFRLLCSRERGGKPRIIAGKDKVYYYSINGWEVASSVPLSLLTTSRGHEYSISLETRGDSLEVQVKADPLGDYPIYFHRSSGRMLISTDLYWLRRHVYPKRVVLDRRYFAGYVLHRMMGPLSLDESRTPYIGISKIPGGHIAVLTSTSQMFKRYSYYDRFKHSTVRQVRAALMDNLSAILEGHESIGVLLSGGLDSSSLLYTLREILGPLEVRKRVTAISHIFPSYPYQNEEGFIDFVTREIGIRCSKIDSDGSWVFRDYPDPKAPSFATPYPGSFYRQAVDDVRVAKEIGISLVLSGIGGDEVFGVGFSPAYLPALFRSGRILAGTRHLVGWAQVYRASVTSVWRHSFKRESPQGPNEVSKPRWLTVDCSHSSDASILHDMDGFNRRRLMAFWKHSTLPEGIWMKTELYRPEGITFGYPYFGWRVIQAAWSVPPHRFGHPLIYKHLLKTVMSRTVPPRIRLRENVSTFYDSMVDGWEKHERERILASIRNGSLVRSGWVDGDGLVRDVERICRGYGTVVSMGVEEDLWIERAVAYQMWLDDMVQKENVELEFA